MSAEGGDVYDPTEPLILDDGDDDYDVRQSLNTTQPFEPGQPSTPYHRGEQVEMQTMQQEASGLPEKSFVVETSFGASKTSEKAWLAAKDLFPNMSSSDLVVLYDTKGKLKVKMFGASKKTYSLITTDRSTGKESINKSLPKEIKTALGQSKYEKVQQIKSEKRKQLKESEERALQKEKKKKDMDEIREKLRQTQRNLESLENSDAPERDKQKYELLKQSTLKLITNIKKVSMRKRMNKAYKKIWKC